MPESFQSRKFRWMFNLYPAYRGTGARVTYVADDFKQVRVKLPLSWRTRNYVGTIYGGSIYGSIDPIYMLMLIKILGPEYVVWDKSATIYFRKPGRHALFADLTLAAGEIEEIVRLAENERSVDRTYHVDLADKHGVIHASVEKVVYIAKRASK